jgi:hypothetical protein
MKNSLSTKGLSLSQAQSISNLCNQRSIELSNTLSDVNNVEKTLTIGSDTYIETPAKPLPGNVAELIQEKARLAATQAFLMENIKAKDSLIKSIQREQYYASAPRPESPEYVEVELKELVTEEWAWNELSAAEYNEFLEAEAYAAHIGQFIHKGGTLDRLRTELPKIKTLEFMEIETGKKTPMKVAVHHTSAQLLSIHEELASSHREYEQKVNYFKSKVKNAVTKENARIANENGDAVAKANEANQTLRDEFRKLNEEWNAFVRKETQEFEAKRQGRIEAAVALKIDVAPRFQPVVDEFLKTIK